MVKFWERMTIRQRVSLAIVIVAMLGFVGSFIWGYSHWPNNLFFMFYVLLPLPGVLGNPGARRDPHARNAHPQENDPNRR
jgi:hypothetical protein